MSTQLNSGDRVVVIRGSYNSEHGKVTGSTIYGFLFRKVPVKLDQSGSTEILEGDLELENLSRQEVTSEVNKVRKQIDNVLPKLSSEMKKEIPTHLGYLQNALNSEEKDRATAESAYLQAAIPTIRKIDSVQQDWGEDVKISLDKIQNWIKQNLR